MTRIPIGMKSLLFGAHWPMHVIDVVIAWRWLYGNWPTARECVAIALHDVGYWNVREMDGPDGLRHPELGARIADQILGREYGDLIRGHSKGYADLECLPLSRFYGPDKLSHAFVWTRGYVLRTRLSGELRQYRSTLWGEARKNDAGVNDDIWFRVIRMRMTRGGISYAINEVAPDGLGAARGR